MAQYSPLHPPTPLTSVGYICGRFNVLPTGRGKSVLAAYIFNLALPAGILYNVMHVEMTNIDSGAPKSLNNFLLGYAIVAFSFGYAIVAFSFGSFTPFTINEAFNSQNRYFAPYNNQV